MPSSTLSPAKHGEYADRDVWETIPRAAFE